MVRKKPGKKRSIVRAAVPNSGQNSGKSKRESGGSGHNSDQGDGSSKMAHSSDAQRAKPNRTPDWTDPDRNGAKRTAGKVLEQLSLDYPEAGCSLGYRTPFQLLIATILSAQCTDERVNRVTKSLFRSYRSPAAFAAAPIRDIEKSIRSTGFFRNKAKNIKACSIQLIEEHQGKVPRDMCALISLAGVGRKTANVVLGTAYGLALGVVVDTHVGRISRRLGLTRQIAPIQVERDLMQLLPKKEWIDFSHRMIQHGRAVCAARKALCDSCSMIRFCPRVGVE
jgi:endonuclease III